MTSKLLRIFGKLVSFTGGIVLTLSVVLVIFFYSLLIYGASRFMARNSLDVSRRLMSPDKSKTAFLLRDYGFDLNIGVTYISGGDRITNAQPYSRYKGKAKTLFWSRDIFPHLHINCNENIEWSADSSLLKLTFYDPDAEEHIVWAYDFVNHEEIKDHQEITTLWSARNQATDGNELTPNRVVD